jgi:hypothetical protein
MICALAVCSFAFGLYIAFYFVFRFHPQTVSEVITLARFVNQKELEDLASAVIEENLRASLPARRFRTEQRKRAILLLEYLRRMSHNSWVILSWAYQLQDRSQGLVAANDSLTVAITDALAAAAPFRLYSLIVLPRGVAVMELGNEHGGWQILANSNAQTNCPPPNFSRLAA